MRPRPNPSEPEAATATQRSRRTLRAWLSGAIVVGLVGLGVMAFFLWIYRAKGYTMPMGWDTSRYLWRTTLAQAVGIAHLDGAVPSFVNADTARPAYPVVASSLGSLFRAGPFRLAAALPAVSAAIIGLAAGAFVAAVLRRSTWELTVVAAAVGTSAFMVRMLGPEAYQDNLFAAAVFMAASVPIAMSVWDRRALLPAILLFGAGGVIHWAFFVFMLLTLAVAAAAYLPASWRAFRRHERAAVDTPSGRLAVVVAGGAGVAAVTIYGILGTTTRSPRLSQSEFEKKLNSDLPKYRFPVTLPTAAMGAVSLFLEARRRNGGGGTASHGPESSTAPNGPPGRIPAEGSRSERARFALTYLVAWCGVALAGLLGFVLLDLSIPAHRFLAFALAVPVLAALAVLWAGRLAARVAPAVGAALVVALVGLSAWTSHVAWFDIEPWISGPKIEQAAAMASYLEQAEVDSARPVVFLLVDRDASYVALMSHMVRAVLPAERIRQAYFYAGSADDYLAGRPTPDATGLAGALSSRYFEQMRETYGRDPVALLPKLFNGTHYASWVAAHPETVVGRDLAVVRGPVPAGPLPVPASPIPPASTAWLALLAVGSLAVLGLAGMGWTVALLGRWVRPVQAVAIAPAVGLAFLVLAGIVVDRVGFRLTGVAGAATPVAVAVTGWGAARWIRRSPDPE